MAPTLMLRCIPGISGNLYRAVAAFEHIYILISHLLFIYKLSVNKVAIVRIYPLMLNRMNLKTCNKLFMN